MDLSKKIAEIHQKHQELNEKRITYQERLRLEQKKLDEVVSEIKEKGYDPKNLKKIHEDKERELEKVISEVEASLENAQKILEEIEKADANSN